MYNLGNAEQLSFDKYKISSQILKDLTQVKHENIKDKTQSTSFLIKIFFVHHWSPLQVFKALTEFSHPESKLEPVFTDIP